MAPLPAVVFDAVEPPPEGDDPDTYVRKHGTDGWRRKLRESETLTQFLLAQLRSECDLASAEGRARFISVAKPHVQKVAAPALRLQLVNEIAQLARVAHRFVPLGQKCREPLVAQVPFCIGLAQR